MLEGRGSNATGWLIVALAVVALVAFTGLLYIRGGSPNGAGITIAGATPGPGGTAVAARPSSSASPSAPGATTSPRPTARPSGATSSAAPSRSPAADPSGTVAGATSRPTAAATRSPKPPATPALSPSAGASSTGYRLPRSPQRATVALTNGQGGCPAYPTDGVVIETSFAVSSSGRLTATSPANRRLSGQLKADGSFALSGSSPTERWIGTLTETGGTGSYFVVTQGCTEGYESTIAFHP